VGTLSSSLGTTTLSEAKASSQLTLVLTELQEMELCKDLFKLENDIQKQEDARQDKICFFQR